MMIMAGDMCVPWLRCNSEYGVVFSPTQQPDTSARLIIVPHVTVRPSRLRHFQVNLSPALNLRTPYLRALIPNMIEGVLEVAVDANFGIPEAARVARKGADPEGGDECGAYEDWLGEWLQIHESPPEQQYSQGPASGVRFLLQGHRLNMQREKLMDVAQKRKDAISRIQHCFRWHYERRCGASVHLQRVWRGFAAFQRFRQLRVEHAATHMQRVVRGGLGRSVARYVAACLRATKIQRVWRSALARSKAGRLRCRRAALRVQCGVRCRWAVRRARQFRCARRIQRMFWRVLLRVRHRKGLAAVAIQACVRRCGAEKSVVLMRERAHFIRGITALQSLRRRQFVQRWAHERVYAGSVMQRAWRFQRNRRIWKGRRRAFALLGGMSIRIACRARLLRWRSAARSMARQERRMVRAQRIELALTVQRLCRGRQARLGLIREGMDIAAGIIARAWREQRLSRTRARRERARREPVYEAWSPPPRTMPPRTAEPELPSHTRVSYRKGHQTPLYVRPQRSKSQGSKARGKGGKRESTGALRRRRVHEQRRGEAKWCAPTKCEIPHSPKRGGRGRQSRRAIKGEGDRISLEFCLGLYD